MQVSYTKALFKSDKLADCVVRFYVVTSPAGSVPEKSSSDTAWLSEAIPAHKLILAGGSERLEAQLLNPGWQSSQFYVDAPQEHRSLSTEQPAASAGPTANRTGMLTSAVRPLLAVPLEGAHELEAAMDVLCFMYEGKLTPGLTVTQLLLIGKVAQYLLCNGCIAACGAALAAVKYIRPEDAFASFHESASVLEEQDLQAFARMCGASVADFLGSTLSIVCSEDLHSKFFGLPIVALQLLLSGQLPVECEETAVLLLHRWVLHNKPPAEVSLQLRKLLRPLGLGPSYLHFVLPSLEWMGLSTQHLNDLFFAVTALHAGNKPAGLEGCLLKDAPLFKAEPQWLQQRSYSQVPANCTVTATWAEAELQQCIDAMLHGADSASCSRSPATYLYGFKWQLELRLQRLPAANSSSELDAGAGLFLIASPVTEFATLCATIVVDRKFLVAVRRALEDWRGVAFSGFCSPADDTSDGCGLAPLFMSKGALQMALWADFLVDGSIKVQVS